MMEAILEKGVESLPVIVPTIEDVKETKRNSYYPLTRPSAPRLSGCAGDLERIESSHLLSNYGPINRRLESAMTERLFGGLGASLTVSSATVGLMLALKEAVWRRPSRARLVIMPALTFAATAQSALWAGLTPVLIDVDPDDWTARADAEDEAFARFGDEIAAVMPYAAFGRDISLDRYDDMADRHGVSIVVDAASSIGTLNGQRLNFGAGSRHTIVFSMHATKAFGVGEGGLIYSTDLDLIARLRRMGNFGLDDDRSAVAPGLNSKMSEVSALSALVKLSDYDRISDHRSSLAHVYTTELQDWQVQSGIEARRAYQFMPMLLPPELAQHRAALQARLHELGVGSGRYFSPHLGQQTYFRQTCIIGNLSTSDELARRIMSLPIHDEMTTDDVRHVCALTRRACQDVHEREGLTA